MDLATEAFAISMLSISVAELGDKTQLALVMLSASLRKPKEIFLGMITGFAIIAGASVLIGQALLAILPLPLLTVISGLIFVVVGNKNVIYGGQLLKCNTRFMGAAQGWA